MRLSVVIPALDAADTLPETLNSVQDADEIIVVDGGSRDATPEMAQAAGALVIASAKGRGLQLHTGAKAGGGEWLLFLHADTRLGRDWRTHVAEHAARHPDKAACFRFRLNDAAWQARLIERAVVLRTRLGLPYGDQGLLIARTLYDDVGGYAPLPLMEDVDLVRRIGRQRLRLLDADAVTSAERWQRDGWFRRSARNLTCLGLYLGGIPTERVATLYSPSPRWGGVGEG